MKIRNGFVSNSSSSSFLVMCDKEKTTVKIEVEMDFKEYGEEISDLEQFFSLIDDYYDWKTAEEKAKMIEIAVKAFNEGKVFYSGSFSNEDDSLSQYFCEVGLPKDSKEFTVIDNEGGY